jgi:hypothetical protein
VRGDVAFFSVIIHVSPPLPTFAPQLQKDIRRSEQAGSPRLISTSTVEKVARLADGLIEERHEEVGNGNMWR